MVPPDILSLSNILLDIQGAIPALMETYGVWIYGILFAIIFCETGLVFAPFLPGDSLLFLMGFLAAGGGLNIGFIIIVLALAAILGDSVNYRIGTYFGHRLLNREKCLVDRRHVEMTRQYYRKYGKKTIVIARFIPGIRSFAPFVAGIVKMDYPVFLTFNVTGGLLWVTGFVLFGYLVGSLPVFAESQDLFLWAILGISIGIFLFMMYQFRKNVKECAVPEEVEEEIAEIRDMQT
jgi:membrane-associated protein